MKDYAKVGNRKGRPAYRTPSRLAHAPKKFGAGFIAKKSIENKKASWRPWDQATRLEYRRIKERRKRPSSPRG